MTTPADTDIQPIIIIKRKKVVAGDEHHGGAWKVAYADFVTAMMAFFLLMWLLNATTEEQRKGLADYFNPTIPISRISGGGSDGLNGSSIFTEETFARMGTGATREQTVSHPDEDKSNKSSDMEVVAKLQQLQSDLDERDGHLSDHVTVKLSPEGIIVELVDSDDKPLFSLGRSEPTPLMLTLLEVVSGSFDQFGNSVKIVGHTDDRQYTAGGTYDNWSLSLDRGATARRALVGNGVAAARIIEVSGKADTDPLIPNNPSAAQNRRISIVILNQT
jgi:chemotaxis protein MotB